MKKRIIYVTLALLISSFKLSAQLPVASTAENPVWYYIQVIGESDRAGLVFTEQTNKVFGQSKIISLVESEIASQLWRFEEEAGKYTIINQSSGNKMSLGYDAGKSIRIATITDTPVTQWQFTRNGRGYNIKATANISQGSTANIYAHQANDYGSRNYVIMFESSQYMSVDNSRFQFIEYVDDLIEYSTEDKEVWYYITSANPEYQGKYMTDVVTAGLPFIRFSLEDKEADNPYQHWKVVKKNPGATDQKVHFINRATQNVIQTKSVENSYYKYTQATTDPTDDNGWTMTYLGQSQYELAGEETDGVYRHLCASDATKQPEFYDQSNTLNTSFAWRFEKQDTGSGLPSISTNDLIRVYAKDRFVIVEGSDKYRIYTIQGMEVNQNIQLPLGVYLVTVEGKVVKLFVQ